MIYIKIKTIADIAKIDRSNFFKLLKKTNITAIKKRDFSSKNQLVSVFTIQQFEEFLKIYQDFGYILTKDIVVFFNECSNNSKNKSLFEYII